MALAAFVVALAALVLATYAVVVGQHRRRLGEPAIAMPRPVGYVGHHTAAIPSDGARTPIDGAAHPTVVDGRVRPPWSIIPVGVSMFRLINTDPLVGAYDVTVSAVCETTSLYDPPKGVALGPGESVEFFGLTPDSENEGDTRVRVSWRRTPDGEIQPPWMHYTG